CIDCPDRDASDPVGENIGFVHRLIDTSLVSTERAATLQNEGNALASIRAPGLQRAPLPYRIWRNRRGNIVHGERTHLDVMQGGSLEESRDAAMTTGRLPSWHCETDRECHTVVERISDAGAEQRRFDARR